jgi:bifunctional DNase/RNase
MKASPIEVQVRAVAPLDSYFAIFLGTQDKTFVIHVDGHMGKVLSAALNGETASRPLTHDLMGHLLLAFGARVERVIINRVEDSVFYARLVVSAENELHTKKVVEIDARPSDCLVLALSLKAPVYVVPEVLEKVEDVSFFFSQSQATEEGLPGGSAVKDPTMAEKIAALNESFFAAGEFDEEEFLDEDEEDDDDIMDDDYDEDGEDEDEDEDEDAFDFGFDLDDEDDTDDADDAGDEWK